MYFIGYHTFTYRPFGRGVGVLLYYTVISKHDEMVGNKTFLCVARIATGEPGGNVHLVLIALLSFFEFDQQHAGREEHGNPYESGAKSDVDGRLGDRPAPRQHRSHRLRGLRQRQHEAYRSHHRVHSFHRPYYACSTATTQNVYLLYADN